MNRTSMLKNIIGAALISAVIAVPNFSYAGANDNTGKIQPMVVEQVFKKAQANNNWKSAFVTGKHAQVVFMSVSTVTNPANEIGIEVHPFDQIIFIAEGNAKAIIDGKTSMVKAGDMLFIPQGAQHNVINLSKNKALKIISIYSDTDIPAGSEYKTKADTPKD